jgi:hypothetical protein
MHARTHAHWLSCKPLKGAATAVGLNTPLTGTDDHQHVQSYVVIISPTIKFVRLKVLIGHLSLNLPAPISVCAYLLRGSSNEIGTCHICADDLSLLWAGRSSEPTYAVPLRQ